MGFLTVIIFLIILSILVLIHEFGHYIACKLQHIKVLEFALGFGPKLVGFTKGDTLYRVNLIPFGGYVRPLGEGEYQDPASDSFEAQKAYKRLIVILAGVGMNFIFAFVIYSVFLFSSGFRADLPSLVPNHFPFGEQSTQISIQPIQTSPAYKALEGKNYVFVSVNGKHFGTESSLAKFVNQNKGKYLDFNLINVSNQHPVNVKLYSRPTHPKDEGALGVLLTQVYQIEFKGIGKIFSGIGYSIDLLQYNVVVLKSLITSSIHTHNASVVTSSVTGPVGLFIITQDVFHQSGLIGLINLIGLLSIGLGLANILPFPALDGGHSAFILIEMITRRKINPKVLGIVNNIGMIALIMLMVAISINDVNNFNVVDSIKHLFSGL